MTGPVFLARPVRGLVGETRRVVHTFDVPRGETPSRLVAFCGADFGPGELEIKNAPEGMPCMECLRHIPVPAS
ncbi:hypothetical protein QRX50_22355 [Amycolatopsis carbonis]|uniref:Uncharacterized protein n=1 Tax=Amycolatopsis carbonis TaxID=715471 RepID=A0A9Y2N1R1_9PSEU|nr:hypothetical protein [Amycolatopsis sp. 2-15]WIX83304.1 hypothetical protein QRX50_22355 [Amycolatopsis sp. 2-15]